MKKSKKTIDNREKVCYNKDTKGKGNKKMKKEINYMNCETGEVTKLHSEAMEWYRAGVEIALIDYSETLQEWVERMRWVH